MFYRHILESNHQIDLNERIRSIIWRFLVLCHLKSSLDIVIVKSDAAMEGVRWFLASNGSVILTSVIFSLEGLFGISELC